MEDQNGSSFVSSLLGLTISLLMHLRISPDGKSIVFTASEQPGRTEVWVMENFLPIDKK